METKDNELRKSILELEGVVAFAKAVRQLNKSGDTVKTYVTRKLETQRQHYRVDKETRELMDTLIIVIEKVYGIQVSKSILVRAGIRKLYDHIFDIIDGKSSDNILKIINEEVEFFKLMGKC